MGCCWFTGHASNAALTTYTGIETAEFQKAEEFLRDPGIRAEIREGARPRALRVWDKRLIAHQDRSELPRAETMTNAWPKADETSSARPRRLKTIVANKLYNQMMAWVTFPSLKPKFGLQFFKSAGFIGFYLLERNAAAEFP